MAKRYNIGWNNISYMPKKKIIFRVYFFSLTVNKNRKVYYAKILSAVSHGRCHIVQNLETNVKWPLIENISHSKLWLIVYVHVLITVFRYLFNVLRKLKHNFNDAKICWSNKDSFKPTKSLTNRKILTHCRNNLAITSF